MKVGLTAVIALAFGLAATSCAGDAEPAASSDRGESYQPPLDERCSDAPSSGLQITGFSADAIATFSSSASTPEISDLAESVGRAGANVGLQTTVNYEGRVFYLDWAEDAATADINAVEAQLLDSDLVVEIVACTAP
jgi:hypothetical protein